MRTPRWTLLGNAVFFGFFFAGFAAAAAPDRPPEFRADHTALLTPSELKSRIERRFALFEQWADDPGQLLRDKVSSDEWAEVRWALQRTSNHGQVNAALAKLGVGSPAESRFRINLQEFPQWRALDAELYTLRTPGVLSLHEDGLKERGFTDADVAELKAAIEEGVDPFQVAELARTSLLEQYAAHFKAKPGAGKQFDRVSASAFAYQCYLASMDSQRRWAVDVLDKVGKRRERILLSYFLELEGFTTFAPDQGHESRLREAHEIVTSDRYIEVLKQREQRK